MQYYLTKLKKYTNKQKQTPLIFNFNSKYVGVGYMINKAFWGNYFLYYISSFFLDLTKYFCIYPLTWYQKRHRDHPDPPPCPLARSRSGWQPPPAAALRLWRPRAGWAGSPHRQTRCTHVSHSRTKIKNNFYFYFDGIFYWKKKNDDSIIFREVFLGHEKFLAIGKWGRLH